MAAACTGQSAGTAGGAGSAASLSPSAAGAASAPAVLADRSMIVLLRDQLTALNVDRSTAPARATAIAASHKPLVDELQALKARAVHSFETINGFATKLSQQEVEALSARPEVLAVVPDRPIKKKAKKQLQRPTLLGALPSLQSSNGASATATAVPALCNTLEPEALQIMNVAFLDGSTPQAQTVLDGRGRPVTGEGVTVAVIADGLDPNVPGFVRPDGSKVFVDYQDFTGDPAGTPTDGGEIYGDASSVAAQDMPNGQPLLYDISQFGYVNPPGPCNIRIRGVAPGASLVGIDILGQNTTTISVAVQAIDWAVVHDRVDVINESLGLDVIADAATDPFSLANAAAVQAGVTVTVASGDAGSDDAYGSPGTDPHVIAAGASTQFRAYAQTDFGPYPIGVGYVDDNVSSFSSGGFAQARPRMVDVLAPGDASWALCSTNEAIYQGCQTFNGAATPIEFFGGTSEAAPLTAGAAALVIQAYRSTHGGQSPSPALVKAILMSSAVDLGAPASEQGAGRIDALAAVHTAMSEPTSGNAAPPQGGLLLATPSAVELTAQAGSTLQSSFQITNTGTTALHLQPALQQLGPASAGQTVSLNLATLNPAYTPYAIQTFTVPANTDHLDVSIGFSPQTVEQLGLFDPQGRLVAYSFPQGGGSGYGSVDAVKPTAGTWTAFVYGSAGPCELTWAAQSYVSLGSVSPSRLNLPPGASTTVTATFQAPSQPGDLSAALRFPGSALSEIPVGVRVLVPIGPTGGSFQGTLTGGNGRGGNYPTETYAFDVPPGVNNLALSLTVPDGGYAITGILVDPNGAVLDSADSASSPSVEEQAAVELLRANPQAGQWRLLVLESQASGNETSIEFTANIAFNAAQVSAAGLPNNPRSSVSAAKGATVALSVTNTGVVPESYFADARLSSLTTLTLPTQAIANTTLPGYVGATIVPTRVAAVEFQAQASLPITMDAQLHGPFGLGEDPDVWALPVGNGTVAAFLELPEVPYGPWFISPVLVGNFGAAGAPSTSATTTATAVLQAFDTTITASTGDFWADQVLGTSVYQPLVLAPGATGTITLAIQPEATSVGRTVQGSIYVDTFNLSDPYASGDEVVALPYAYTVAP